MYLSRHQTLDGPRWALDDRFLPAGVQPRSPAAAAEGGDPGLSPGLPRRAARHRASCCLRSSRCTRSGPAASPTCAAARRARPSRRSRTSTPGSTRRRGRSCSGRRIGWRVAGHQMPIRVRDDSRWNVPEPELVLVVNASREIVGFCVGNDVSSRDIEGENPLYLPQAKVYDGSCALGPGIRIGETERLKDLSIQLEIARAGRNVFQGETRTAQIKRPLEELVAYPRHGARLSAGRVPVHGHRDRSAHGLLSRRRRRRSHHHRRDDARKRSRRARVGRPMSTKPVLIAGQWRAGEESRRYVLRDRSRDQDRAAGQLPGVRRGRRRARLSGCGGGGGGDARAPARGHRAVPGRLRDRDRGGGRRPGRDRGARDRPSPQPAPARGRAAPHDQPAAAGGGRGPRSLVVSGDDRHQGQPSLRATGRSVRWSCSGPTIFRSPSIRSRAAISSRRSPPAIRSSARRTPGTRARRSKLAELAPRGGARGRPAPGGGPAPLPDAARGRLPAGVAPVGRARRGSPGARTPGCSSRRRPTRPASRSISRCRASTRSSCFPARSRSARPRSPRSSPTRARWARGSSARGRGSRSSRRARAARRSSREVAGLFAKATPGHAARCRAASPRSAPPSTSSSSTAPRS